MADPKDYPCSRHAAQVSGCLRNRCPAIAMQNTPQDGVQLPRGLPQVGDTDEVWYDLASNSYYFAHTSEGATELSTANRGAVGIVNGATEEFVTTFPSRVPGFTLSPSMQRMGTSSFRFMERAFSSSCPASDVKELREHWTREEKE